MPNLTAFVPPPYPYERIDRFKPLGDRFEGGLVDLSIGTPCDPPPASVVAALGAGAVMSIWLVPGCSSPDDPGVATGGAGAGGAAGTGGSVGGSSAGGVAPGTGGTTSGTGGTNAGTGGTTSGTGGAASGAGGAASSSAGALGGMSGSTGDGGRGGTSGGRGGNGGASGSAGSGTGGSAGAMPSTGCGKAPPASNRYTMDVSGTMREYILAVPSNYDPMRPYRLIFAWHPLGGSAQQTAGNGNSGYYGLQGQSMGSAILVSAEGLQQNGTGSRGWWNTGGGDIAFFRAMIERFKTEMCIDQSRIFSTGFSFGGMMSFSVGCTGLVRAIAPMSGNPQVSGCTAGTTPVAMMGFHGDDDTVVDIDGGRQGRDIFIDRNGCSEPGMTATPSWCDGVNQSNEPCTCTSYPGCTAGYPVTWCEFNGGHTPAPGSEQAIWDFFAQF